MFSAFSGGGAGIIQLPAILLLFEITFPVALATHKVSTVLLGLGASLKFFEKNIPNKKMVKIMIRCAGKAKDEIALRKEEGKA